MPKVQQEESDARVLAEEIWLAADAMRAEGLTHPPRSVLVAYQRNSLDSERESSVRRHIVLCTECAQTILDLAEPQSSRSEVLEAEASREVIQNPVLTATNRTSSRFHPSRGQTLLLAASFASLVAVGWWAIELRRHLGEVLAPQANVWVADLVSIDTDNIRSETSIRKVVVPDPYQRLVLLLNLADRGSYRDYQLEVLDQDSLLLFRLEGLEPRPEGGFSIELPDVSQFVGPIRLDLYGIRQEQTKISSFLVEIVKESPE